MRAGRPLLAVAFALEALAAHGATYFVGPGGNPAGPLVGHAILDVNGYFR